MTRPRSPTRSSSALVLGVCLGLLSPLVGSTEHNERAHLDTFCHGEKDVRLYEGSTVDCVQEGHAIVVAYAPDWAQAIGRTLFYSAVTKLSPGILIIMRSDEDLVYSNRLYTPIRELDLGIKVWLKWEGD